MPHFNFVHETYMTVSVRPRTSGVCTSSFLFTRINQFLSICFTITLSRLCFLFRFYTKRIPASDFYPRELTKERTKEKRSIRRSLTRCVIRQPRFSSITRLYEVGITREMISVRYHLIETACHANFASTRGGAKKPPRFVLHIHFISPLSLRFFNILLIVSNRKRMKKHTI